MQSRHFTLIEILISIGVMVIGLVGIMAVFPVGLEASKNSMVDTACATLANSVRNALVTSIQSSPIDAAGTPPPVIFRHDGSEVATPIPLDTEAGSGLIPLSNVSVTNWKEYANSSGDPYLVGRGVDGAMGITVFDSENELNLFNYRTSAGIENQISYKLDIRRFIVQLPGGPGGIVSAPGGAPLEFGNLFEVQIKVYRNYQGAGSQPLRAYTSLVTGNRLVD